MKGLLHLFCVVSHLKYPSCTGCGTFSARGDICSQLKIPFYLMTLYRYVKSGYGVKRMADVENGAQQSKFVGGSQQISDRLAERLGTKSHHFLCFLYIHILFRTLSDILFFVSICVSGKRVHLNSPVKKIIWNGQDEQNYGVTVITESGNTFKVRELNSQPSHYHIHTFHPKTCTTYRALMRL